MIYQNKNRLTIDFYGDNIFRLFQDNQGGILRDPEAKPEAKVLVNNARKPLHNLYVQEENNYITIRTEKVLLQIDKETTLLSIVNTKNGKTVLKENSPVSFGKSKVSLSLQEDADEYFYGGGVQNGRFSHKGKMIAIENQNSWTDGGVASPTPFYWSTNGYGLMFYTFKKGKYDFGATEPGCVKLSHQTNYF